MPGSSHQISNCKPGCALPASISQSNVYPSPQGHVSDFIKHPYLDKNITSPPSEISQATQPTEN